MRAAMLHDADPAVGVAEGDQLFAEQQEPHRLAVGLEFGRETGGNPVLPHQITHGRTRPNARQHVIRGCSQHGFLRFVRLPNVRTIIAKRTETGES